MTFAMVKGREVTPDVSGTPPFEDSQPIPATLSEDELQLAVKGSPILTTALWGLVSTGQKVPTTFPTSVQCEL